MACTTESRRPLCSNKYLNTPVVLSILLQDGPDSSIMSNEVKPYNSKIIQIKSMILFEALEMLIFIPDKTSKKNICMYLYLFLYMSIICIMSSVCQIIYTYTSWLDYQNQIATNQHVTYILFASSTIDNFIIHIWILNYKNILQMLLNFWILENM